MMQNTLSKEANRNVSLYSSDMGSSTPENIYENGKLVGVNGIAVFRSGTFRDSMGFQHVWEDIHIDQMISNFEFLRGRGIFDSVPVRAGHPSFLANPINEVIGYVTNLYKKMLVSKVDGKEYSYLLADYSISDPVAAEKIDNQLWRNRSAEIGSYVTNDEMEFWPTFMGFAYVDIPAVEGLNFSKNNGSKFSVLIDSEEDAVTVKNTGLTEGDAEGTTSTSGVETGVNEDGTVVSTDEGDNKEVNETSNDATDEGDDSDESTDESIDESAKRLVEGDFSKKKFSFRINGNETFDFASVQSHIDTLEAALSEQRDARRKEFVDELFNKNIILACQKDDLTSLVLSMDDNQFNVYSKVMESAPVQNRLENYSANDNGNSGHEPGVRDTLSPEIINAKSVVLQHKRAGMKLDDIKNTKSYKILESNNEVPEYL